MKKSLLALALMGAFMAGCSDSSDIARTPQYTAPAAPQPQAAAPAAAAPVVVQQSSGGSSTGDLLTGAALGYMAGNLLNGGASRQQVAPETRVIERRTVVNNYIERPSPAKATPTVSNPTPAAPAKPNYGATYQQAKPAPAPSYGSTYAAAKPAPSKSSYASSYSSSRSSSSFSSPSRSSFSSPSSSRR